MGVHAEVAAPDGAAADTVLTGFAGVVDKIVEAICVTLMLAALVVACAQVLLRYVFHAGLPWSEEVAVWCFCWAVFLGMGLATGRDAHIAIDTVPNMLKPRAKAALAFFNRAVIAASSFMLIIHGAEYV